MWWVLGIVVLGPLVWSFVPAPTTVEVTTVSRGPLTVTIDEDARTRVRDRFTVAAPVTGYLARIEYRPGAAVRAGEPVAQILPAIPAPVDARARAEIQARVEAATDALQQARVRFESARVVLAQAARDLDRLRQLERDRVLAPQELEAAATRHRVSEADVNTAAAGVNVAEHEMAAARAALLAVEPSRPGGRGSAVRAPQDGTILRVFEESERPIQAGTPLLEIGAPSSLEIVADLLSTDAVQVRAGCSVLLDRWGGDGVLRGRVRLVEPSSFTKVSALGVEEQRVNVVIDFVDPQEASHRLGDGFALEARIVVWEARDAVKVPIDTLLRHGADWFVYKVVQSRAVEQQVRIGRMNDREAAIDEGLAAGDLVIVHPAERITNGARVSIRE
jgi:HlyD family secretion protein